MAGSKGGKQVEALHLFPLRQSSRRSLLLGVGALGLLAAACNPLNQDQPSRRLLSKILSQRKVRVGYTVLAPWATKDPNTGVLQGWYVELARTIFRPVHVEVEFIESTWANFVAGIQTGRYDLSIVPSYPTIQRATALDFTNPISDLANSALVRSDAPFKSVFDLNVPAIRLVAIEGEQSAEFIRSNLQRANLRTLSTGDFPLLYSEVLAGRADAAFGYVDSIKNFVAANPGVRNIAPEPYSVLPICWATSYDAQDFRDFLNSALAYLRGNGTMRALQLKYKG